MFWIVDFSFTISDFFKILFFTAEKKRSSVAQQSFLAMTTCWVNDILCETLRNCFSLR